MFILRFFFYWLAALVITSGGVWAPQDEAHERALQLILVNAILAYILAGL